MEANDLAGARRHVDRVGDHGTDPALEMAQVLVPLRQFRQYLGVDWASQYQRTKCDEILAREMMSVVLLTRPRWSISRLWSNRA